MPRGSAIGLVDPFRRFERELAWLYHHVEQRVLRAELETPHLERADREVPASRETLAVAVRRLGQAHGAEATAGRLRELAAEALAWADALTAVEDDDGRPRRRPSGP
jgi:hypothetical protein